MTDHLLGENVPFNTTAFPARSYSSLRTLIDSFAQSENPFKTVCNGCLTSCLGCSFNGEKGSPICTSLLDAGIEHATSQGGTTTLEGLRIQRGYWRAINTSRNILKCFNTKACTGGLTGSPNYCSQGYEGLCELSS